MANNEHIRTVAAAALAHFDAVADWLGLSGGKNEGREYVCLNPLRNDHKPGSFKVNRDSGAWRDWADDADAKGGDLVALSRYLLGLKSQGEAADRLAEFLGIAKPGAPDQARNDERGAGNTKASTASKKPANGRNSVATNDTCIMPVPDDAPAPPVSHTRHGKPSHRWEYRAVDGRVNFLVYRWEATKEQRKQFSPVSLWRTAAGKLEWKFKGPPAPQPLHGLPSLAKAGAVVIVEGEKAADAAAILLPDHPVITWQGGAQAVSKADFSPLAGREVWLWPDNDEAGTKAMDAVAAALFKIGVKHETL